MEKAKDRRTFLLISWSPEDPQGGQKIMKKPTNFDQKLTYFRMGSWRAFLYEKVEKALGLEPQCPFRWILRPFSHLWGVLQVEIRDPTW